ncbi:acyltransferase [Novosphingobium sp. TH158]|uniref:acyltransferase family protein n=1 Tax=Novosphingobium sp. TH158 TaxID=2067455 RepID=UPI0013040C30|nr:acyltransferase family protein [Novosphingobium sp. TH158]
MTLERTDRGADFVISRFARLFPAYWAGVAATSLLVRAMGAPELAQPGWIVAANLTMLQGFLYLPSVDGVYWSLTVELAFYLCMFALWKVRWLHRIEAVLIGWVSLKLLWWVVPVLPSRLGQLLLVDYVPWFAVGIAAYRVRARERRWAQQLPLFALCAAVIGLVDGLVGLLVLCATAGLFAALAEGRLGLLDRPVLLWLGGLSYPLYLVHQLVGYALIARLEEMGASPLLALVLTLAAALALAQVIRSLIEQPALRAIRSWWQHRSRKAGALAAS